MLNYRIGLCFGDTRDLAKKKKKHLYRCSLFYYISS